MVMNAIKIQQIFMQGLLFVKCFITVLQGNIRTCVRAEPFITMIFQKSGEFFFLFKKAFRIIKQICVQLGLN